MENNVNEEVNKIEEITPEENKKEKYKVEFKSYNMKWQIHLILILVGYLGLQLLATAVGYIALKIMTSNGIDLTAASTAYATYSAGLDTYVASDLKNYLDYIIWIQVASYILTTIAILCSLLPKHLPTVFKDFKEKSTWINGLAWGCVLVGGQYAITIITNLIFPSSTVNANESLIRLLTDGYYIPMFIVTVFCAPIVEESAYRLGLLGLINKKNGWAALIVSAVVFALLHFDFDAIGTSEIVNELINLPTYIYCGIILGLAYTRNGKIAESMTAHMFNNAFSMILSLLSSSAIMAGRII